MYYDLVASLPQLPYFARAERLPITPLRLEQRLRLLRAEHADQLARARAIIPWQGKRMLHTSDEEHVLAFEQLLNSRLDAQLREFVQYRFQQQTLLAALRRKHDGLGLPNAGTRWGEAKCVHRLRRHWELPDFRLTPIHPWLSRARELLQADDGHGLEQLLMEVTWRRLDQCREGNMFSFAAVFGYVFQWDMLRAWLAQDAVQAKVRFTALIDKVTHVQHG